MTAEALLQRNDELTHYVNMLTDVLTEASTEITALKERIAQLEGDGGGARATEGGDGEAAPQVDTSAPAAPPAAVPPTDSSAAPPESSPSVAGQVAELMGTVHSLQAELQVLRENYHRAMNTNDSLRADIEELQAQAAAAEDTRVASARARSSSVAVTAADISADTRVFEILENERYFPLSGWSKQTLSSDWWVGWWRCAGAGLSHGVGLCAQAHLQ